MNKLTKWSLTAALAGFLFGFDTVVISGADQKLQLLWNSTDIFHGSVVMAMALWGTVVGAIFGGIPTRKIGRKKTLLWIGIFYTLSAIGSALANDPITFAIFRFIGGIGVGISGIAAPAYISEIAPAKSRGRLVGLYQFNLVVGILIAFLSNYLLSGLGENDWRYMMGIEALPALLYTVLVLSIPKSPRWLYLNNQQDHQPKAVLDQQLLYQYFAFLLFDKEHQNLKHLLLYFLLLFACQHYPVCRSIFLIWYWLSVNHVLIPDLDFLRQFLKVLKSSLLTFSVDLISFNAFSLQ